MDPLIHLGLQDVLDIICHCGQPILRNAMEESKIKKKG